jgi:uncharacterized protein (DUF58 family)
MKAPAIVTMKLNSRLLPALIAILLVLEIFFPFGVWQALLVGLGSIWLVAYLWARALRNNLSLMREQRYGWAQVGDLLEERFTLVNRGWVPALWVEVIDHSTIPGYSVSRATGVEAKARNSWLTRQTCSRRGVYTLGTTSLRCGDPFGIYQVTIEDSASSTLLVTPPVLPLPTIEVAPGGRSGEGRPSERNAERSISIAGLREYMPGDSLRWIHWPSLARLNQLFVKTFDNTPTGDWWVLLDLENDVQTGEGFRSTVEIGITLAASLAVRGLHANHAVGMIAGADQLVWLPPEASEGQSWKILNTLARVAPGNIPIEQLLAGNRGAFKNRCSLVVITPSLSTQWIGQLIALARSGAVPTVLLVSPSGPSLPPAAVALQALLVDLGIAATIVTPELFDPTRIASEARNVWEWRVLPTGKVIPLRRPADMEWRTLA